MALPGDNGRGRGGIFPAPLVFFFEHMCCMRGVLCNLVDHASHNNASQALRREAECIRRGVDGLWDRKRKLARSMYTADFFHHTKDLRKWTSYLGMSCIPDGNLKLIVES